MRRKTPLTRAWKKRAKFTWARVRRRMRAQGVRRPGAILRSLENRGGRHAALIVGSLAGMTIIKPSVFDTIAWRLTNNEIVD